MYSTYIFKQPNLGDSGQLYDASGFVSLFASLWFVSLWVDLVHQVIFLKRCG